jgi:endoglucanase
VVTRRACLKGALLFPFITKAGAAPVLGGSEPSTWQQFKTKFIREGRVVDTGNKGISHSEGQGVGMLAATLNDDPETFQQLWEFTKSKMQRPDGLIAWRWEPGKGATDPNNASDGDLYVAWALMRAGMQWNKPEYVRHAERLSEALLSQCVCASAYGPVLLPGREGFVSTTREHAPVIVVNPSYWVFPAFDALAQLPQGRGWVKVRATALKVLASTGFGEARLPADWLVLSDPPVPWAERPARFGYEAIRIPLFLAWSRQSTHPAMRALTAYLKAPGFKAWVDLNSGQKAEYLAPAGFEAVAQLSRYVTYKLPPTWPKIDGDYFSASLSLMAECAWRSVQAHA